MRGVLVETGGQALISVLVFHLVRGRVSRSSLQTGWSLSALVSAHLTVGVDCRRMLPRLAFMWILGTQTQILTLTQQVLLNLNVYRAALAAPTMNF